MRTLPSARKRGPSTRRKRKRSAVRAEELAASMEWERAAAEIRRLQAEWKTIGPVRRTKSEALWQRFRGACDTFFDRYKRRDQIELEAKQADREALVREMESLAPAARSEDAATEMAPAASVEVENAALLERVRSLRNRWNQSTPVVRQGADPLSGSFMTALERLLASSPDAFRGTELDVEANQQKMVKLCERVEGFLTDVADLAVELIASAGHDAARSAGGQHHWRTRRRRNEVARDGRGCPRRASGMESTRSGSRRSRAAAERPVPPCLQPILRSVSPPYAAAARTRSAPAEDGWSEVAAQRLKAQGLTLKARGAQGLGV